MLAAGHILGEFEILESIGVGGMGVVYKARQQGLDRTVAVKVLQPSFALDTDFLARFRNEAVLAAGLNHPNIVQVYAAGQTGELHWFAMECVEGESLQGRLSRKGRLDPAEVIAIVLHVVTGLEYAWRKARIIHRDIKPDNSFLSYDGEVKLGDLGLAKSDSAQMKLTLNGVSMGTPHYVSPEHAEGREDLDLRADIYSLGATLYHLISGVTVYSGSTPMSVLMKHLSAEIPDICSFREGLPPVVAEVVTRMLQKAREDRYADYQELGDALRVAHEAISSWRSTEAESVEQVLSANAEGGGVLLREGFAGQEVASGEFAAAKTEMSEEELVAFTGMERALDALEHVERSQPSMGVFPPIGQVKRCREALGRAGYAIAKGDSLPWEVGDGMKGAVDTLRRRLSSGAERVAMINGRLTRTICLVLLGWVGVCLFAVAVTHLATQWRARRESVMKEKEVAMREQEMAIQAEEARKKEREATLLAERDEARIKAELAVAKAEEALVMVKRAEEMRAAAAKEAAAKKSLEVTVLVEGGTLPKDSALAGQVVNDFRIGRTEVTWGEWKETREWAVGKGYDLAGVGAGESDNKPVTQVSLYDVVKWCNALSEREGKTPVYEADGGVYRIGRFGGNSKLVTMKSGADGCRLPLEKEWEWAARGGVSSKGYTYSGGNVVGEVAWTRENSRGLENVGGKKANELGLSDMSGNVWEWVWDLTLGRGSSFRRFRGGSWFSYAGDAEVSNRGIIIPDNRISGSGFRVAFSSGQ